jgi:hypothetical protein
MCLGGGQALFAHKGLPKAEKAMAALESTQKMN